MRGREARNNESQETVMVSPPSSPSLSSSSSSAEYVVEDPRDRIKSSRGSRFDLIENEFRLKSAWRKLSRESVFNGLRDLSASLIYPDNRWYRVWTKFILIWAIYSSFFTPMEFGFFRGLPENLFILDIVGQLVFFVDIVLRFFLAYRDRQTYRMVTNRTSISLRYLKSSFIIDILSCMPWDIIYKHTGRKEGVRYLLWIRLYRVRKVDEFFKYLEKDIRIKYEFTRIIKLIAVELYCTHTAACIFYYLATTLPKAEEGYTWIGSLKLGDYSYSSFRDIDIWKRYITSLYFAIVTMATVGYGDIHAVNMREMVFVMVYVSFDMILGAYLIGNMTALIVKGSKTERYRDKMTDLIKYMNRNKLGMDIRNQIKGHVRLQYESSYTDALVLQDIPISIRAKISQTLYVPIIEKVSLFKGCSTEFINQIVIRLHEEFFLPGEVILEQGSVVDQVYFVCHGLLEEMGIGEEGSEETLSTLEVYSSFGATSILCNIPQPCTVQVRELCRLLRLDKQSFTNTIEMFFHDGRIIFNNLLEGKELYRVKQLESDITLHIGKQEAELALKVNNAVYHGDIYQLKSLLRAGADLNKTDYDGRSPLHLASMRGYEHIVHLLIQEGVQINVKDKLGNTPLFEAAKNGHDQVASLLINEGASLLIDDAGSFLCTAVAKGNSDLVKRMLSSGINPNSKDYDHRTPLHVAASEGLYLMAKLLLEAGGSVFTKDRWGNTPLEEGRRCGNKNLIKILEDAKSAQLSEFSYSFRDSTSAEKIQKKKCTVFGYPPWSLESSSLSDRRRIGVMLWVPSTMEELIEKATAELQLPPKSCILLSEDAGKIIDANMISDAQKLYLVADNETLET